MANRAACGSQFERDICKELSLLLTKQERDDVLWRTAASGARSTIRARQNKHLDQCGDIASTDPSSKWLTDLILFELKNGYPKAFDILSMIERPEKSLIYQWYCKAHKEAAEHGRKHTMLILNRKRYGRYIVISNSFYNCLSLLIKPSSLIIVMIGENTLVILPYIKVIDDIIQCLRRRNYNHERNNSKN